jgi:isovaleryl-CoA dehydrogenase
MNVGWNRRQEEIRARFHEFGREEVAGGSPARDRSGSFDRAVWARLAETDFWRLQVPTAIGGLAADSWDWLAAIEGLAVGASDLGFLMSVAGQSGLIRLLTESGTAEQQEEWLPPLMTGSIAATGSTEAAGGSDVRGFSTRAVAHGSGFVLNGAKAHITNAPVADIVMLVARTDTGPDPFELTVFLMPSSVDGLKLGTGEDLMGLRTSPTGSITFDEVVLDADAVIGGVGHGLRLLYRTLAYDRILFGIMVAGCIEAQIAPLLWHLESRNSFGGPLAEHQYMQEKVVSLVMCVEGSRALAYRAYDLFNRRHESSSLQASATKLYASTGLVNAALDLVQASGHAGYESGSAMERLLRDSVAFKIAGGTDEMQKKNIFNHARRSSTRRRV